MPTRRQLLWPLCSKVDPFVATAAEGEHVVEASFLHQAGDKYFELTGVEFAKFIQRYEHWRSRKRGCSFQSTVAHTPVVRLDLDWWSG